MLALRLARGARPLVQLRRLLVVAASAGVGFLLLCTLGWAVGHPAGSMLRLLWCLIPLAATVQFAVAVARTDPGTKPRSGLSAVGLGPARLTALAA
ncbi:membrane protein, partial [Streptomyces sp. AcH 505]